MSRRHRYLRALAVFALLPPAAVGCGGAGQSEAEAAARATEYRIPVEPYTLRRERFTDHVQATGVLEADADITLTAEVGGTVRAIAAPVGTVLDAGAPVVELDPTDLELALAQAEAALARAEAAHAQAQADVRTDTSLYDQGLAPERQATSMRYTEEMSRAQIEEARAQRDLARRRVEKTRLTSPVAAELSDTYVEVGEWVAPGTPVARIVSVGVLHAVVYLSELNVARVTPGQEAWITADTYPDTAFRATVYSVSPTATPSTRTFRTEIRVPNAAEKRLRPGMAVRVRIVTRAIEDALVAPLDAVADADGAPHLFVVEETPKGAVVRAAPVRLGLRVGRRVQVLEGPPAGTRIAAGSVEMLSDGRAVDLVSGTSGA